MDWVGLGNLFYSTDNGTVWSGIGAGIYASVTDANDGCVVGGNHSVYQITDGNPLTVTEISPQPSFAVARCTLTLGQDPFLAVLGTGGQVSIWDITNDVWDSITVPSSPALTDLVSSGKGITFARDTNGHIYHWNVYAAYTAGATQGSWDGCPGPGEICGPSVVHTGTLQIQFPHGVWGAAGHEALSPNDQMNVTSWDAGSLCDPFYGGDPSDDPDCNISATGSVMCSASGQNLASPPSVYFTIEWFVSEQTQNTGPVGSPYQRKIGVKLFWYQNYGQAPVCTAATTPPDLNSQLIETLEGDWVGWDMWAPTCFSVAPPGSRKGTWFCPKSFGEAIESLNPNYACTSNN